MLCFLSSIYFTEGHTNIPHEAIGASRIGFVPVFLWKPIATIDFLGGSKPQSPYLDSPMFTTFCTSGVQITKDKWCSFETSLCGFKNYNQNNFDWRVKPFVNSKLLCLISSYYLKSRDGHQSGHVNRNRGN